MIGSEAARKDWTEHSRLRALAPVMTITGEGLVLGATVLAKMGRDRYGMQELSVDGAAERILALLAVGPAVLGNIRRASNYWSRGDTALAEIELALGGLQPLNDVEGAALRLSLGERLLAEGTTPRGLMKACGLDPAPLDLSKVGYNPNQPRGPGGNPDGGQWTSDDDPAISRPDDAAPTPPLPTTVDLSPAATVPIEPSIEFVAYKPVHGLPDDAVAVTPPDGKPIADGASKTKKLMAPPRADYRQVYAAGQAIASLPLLSQVPAIRTAVAQGGIYDFQRNPAKRSFYDAYTNASNYAVGVFMSGAGHSLLATKAAAEAYAFFYSSNYGSRKALHWIEQGWRDASASRWQ
jgi:hypothetical protein